jgi:hypothetical protein
MTLTPQHRTAGALRDGEVQSLGRLNQRAYERNSRAFPVQRLIASARRSWKRRYGFDPASVRLKDSR